MRTSLLGFATVAAALHAGSCWRARAQSLRPQHHVRLRYVGFDARQRQRHCGRRGNEHLQHDSDDEPALRPQERHPRRARAGGHRRGELRPDVVPDGRRSEPQHVELVRQRQPAALRALPRHARANRDQHAQSHLDGEPRRDRLPVRLSLELELDRDDVRDLVLDGCGRGGPGRCHVGRAGQRPHRRRNTIPRTPTSRPSTAGSTTSSCRPPAPR